MLNTLSFDFSDFLKQMRLIKRMGSLGGLMKMIPGMNKIDDGMLKSGEEQLKRIEDKIDGNHQNRYLSIKEVSNLVSCSGRRIPCSGSQ